MLRKLRNARQAWREAEFIRQSGVFDRAYYRRHAGPGFLIDRFPEFHYAWRGEFRGLRPNLLFDPGFYRHGINGEWPGRSALYHYLTCGYRYRLDPCQQLDAAWYYFCNPDAENWPNPILHFHDVGLKENRYGLPLIDLVSVRKLAEETGADLLETLDRVMRREITCSGCYNDLAELKAAQADFLAGITITTVQPRAAPARRNLVFVQAGRRFRPWTLPAERSWDLCLNWYDDGWRSFGGEADLQFAQPGTKFTAIAKLFEAGFAFTDYDYVWFLDDDVVFDHGDIERLFAAARGYRLDLLQPSLSLKSACMWHVFYHDPKGAPVRFTNGVEIMMPVLSRRMLELSLPFFNLSISGYGLDLFLGAVAGGGRCGNVAVLNDMVAEHCDSVDHGDGAYYALLRRHNINPQAEMYDIARTHRTDRGFHEV